MTAPRGRGIPNDLTDKIPLFALAPIPVNEITILAPTMTAPNIMATYPPAPCTATSVHCLWFL